MPKEPTFIDATQNLAECPTCHAMVAPGQRLNDELDGVCDVCALMHSELTFAHHDNHYAGFQAYAFQHTHEKVTCTIFFRREFSRRKKAFCVECHQWGTNACYVAVSDSLDGILLKLKSLGLHFTKWEAIERDNLHQFVSHTDYGWLFRTQPNQEEVRGTFNTAPKMVEQNLEEHPF